MEIVVRATAVYWFLWMLVRGTGKRSLASLSPLDLLVVIVIGDFVQQGVTEEDMSISGGLIAISTFAVWMLLADFLARRSRRIDHLLNGRAVIVMEQGELHLERLRRERLTLEDFHSAARKEGIARLDEIDVAVLETDGAFSFIRRSP